MNRKKLSSEEIQTLRSNAEKERATHAEVMKNINATVMSPKLQLNTLKSSYDRQRHDEIQALLEAYSKIGKRYELCPQVKVFIYNHPQELQKERLYMLQNNHLGYEVEKRIIDDGLSPFMDNGNGKLTYPKFCPDAEVYLVKETLKACEKALTLVGELVFLDKYTQTNKLSVAAEIALMEFLMVTTGRDSVIDGLASFVLTYIGRYPDLHNIALTHLIKSGNHNVIMYAITKNMSTIHGTEAEDVLLERADEEEVTAYFNRWARES